MDASNFHKHFVRPCERCQFKLPMKDMLVAVNEGDGYYNCPQCDLQIMRSMSRMIEKNMLHKVDPDFNNTIEEDNIRGQKIKV